MTVLRLICEGTVEEGILKCAEAKLQLEQDLNQINGTSGVQNREGGGGGGGGGMDW